MPALLALALGAAVTSASAAPPAEDAPVELTSGWEWREADGPWAPWDAARGFPSHSGEHEGFLRTALPAGSWRAPALFIGGVAQELEASVDGQVVYRTPRVRGPLSPWYLIPLPQPIAGRQLVLRIASDSPDLGPYGRIAVGSPEMLLLQILRTGAAAFALALFAGAMAAASLALWVRRPGDRHYLAFAAWAALVMVRILALDPARQLLLASIEVWERALPLTRLCGPIAMCGLIVALFPERHPWVRRAFLASLLPAAALSLLILFALPTTYPFINRVINAEWLFSEVLVLGALALAAVRGSREAQVLAVAYAISTAAAVHDIAAALHFIGGNPYSKHYGDLLLIAALASVVLGRLTTVHAQLQRHTREVELANQQLREAEARLTEALASRDDFLAVAAHELRTPLTALRIQSERLIRSAPASDLAAKIGRQLDRLHALIEKLLDVARARAGSLSIDPRELDAAALVREVIARSSDEAARAGCAITLEAPATLAVRWDRDRFDQVLTNLLTNAFKFGAGKPVAIALTRDDARARFTVQDGGIGIAPADHQRIFNRFERAASPRHYGGLGLGLWITSEIVKAMGGSIAVQSAPGQGALFTVVLPINQPPT